LKYNYIIIFISLILIPPTKQKTGMGSSHLIFGWMDELIPDIRDDPVLFLIDVKSNAPTVDGSDGSRRICWVHGTVCLERRGRFMEKQAVWAA
jgi:hypothetical protein